MKVFLQAMLRLAAHSGGLTAFLGCLALVIACAAGAPAATTLSWSVPTTYTDGTPVTTSLSFKIYYGTSSRNYTKSVNVGTANMHTFTTLATGTYYFAVTARDSSGVESGYSNEISKYVDSTAPAISSFSVPPTSGSLLVPVSFFAASDNVGVSGYMITGTSTKPAAGDDGWTATPPASLTFPYPGVKTLYAWVKDAAGNVSKSRIASVKITLPTPVTFSLSIAVFKAGVWRIDADGDGAWDPAFDIKCTFGRAGDVPVVGDWDGDGNIEIGVFRAGATGPARWLLDMNGDGKWDPAVDAKYTFGKAGDRPVVGDWNGDGTTKIGVFRKGVWLLDSDGNGAYDPAVDETLQYGKVGDKPVVGDWNGDGTAEIGVFTGGVWTLDFNGDGVMNGADPVHTFGAAADKPVTGDWDNDGRTEIGGYRAGKWTLDYDGNGVYDPSADRVIQFGGSGFVMISAQ